ncbi:MAG: helix-turn-helix transcriptional regulator [Bacilli bacterium]|nr:helix-turn-helix transcriptional regulator [Bacilli bacterium]
MGMFSKDDENYVYELVSKNITRIREMRGLTKKELAEKTFFNPHFIYNIENMNYYQTFSIPTLVLLARGLDVDIREFFMEDEELENKETE